MGLEYRHHGKASHHRAGQLMTAEWQKAEAWRWKKAAVRPFIGRSETDPLIDPDRGSGRTLITLVVARLSTNPQQPPHLRRTRGETQERPRRHP
jgi:hypothetical protein